MLRADTQILIASMRALLLLLTASGVLCWQLRVPVPVPVPVPALPRCSHVVLRIQKSGPARSTRKPTAPAKATLLLEQTPFKPERLAEIGKVQLDEFRRLQDAGRRATKSASNRIVGKPRRRGHARSQQLAALRKASNRHEVAQLWQDLARQRCTVTEYNMGISAFARAVQLLETMGVPPNTVSFNAAISACSRAKQWERALSLLDQMPARGVRADVVTYSAAISALAVGEAWENALALLQRMESEGLHPNVITMNAAINACEKGQHWEGALELLERMEARGPPPNLVSYNAAISACAKGRQWQAALALLERLHSRGLQADEITCNAAISACAAAGEWRPALALLERMRGFGVAPNTITYNAVLAACKNGGQWERAVALLAQMERRIEGSLAGGDRACVSDDLDPLGVCIGPTRPATCLPAHRPHFATPFPPTALSFRIQCAHWPRVLMVA